MCSSQRSVRRFKTVLVSFYSPCFQRRTFLVDGHIAGISLEPNRKYHYSWFSFLFLNFVSVETFFTFMPMSCERQNKDYLEQVFDPMVCVKTLLNGINRLIFSDLKGVRKKNNPQCVSFESVLVFFSDALYKMRNRSYAHHGCRWVCNRPFACVTLDGSFFLDVAF